MKSIICILLGLVLGLSAEVKEVSVASGQRVFFFDLLRPEVAKKAGIEQVGSVKFEGSLKQGGNWAFFGGRSLGPLGEGIAFGELGNDDTCALFLKTYQGWVLVNWSAGHSDAFYLEWAESYDVDPALLGLSK